MAELDTLEPLEVWVVTIPSDFSSEVTWDMAWTTIEVYTTFEGYSARVKELEAKGVGVHVRQMLCDRRYY
jgi:hypothetical protein